MQISWNDKILNSLKKQKSFTKHKKYWNQCCTIQDIYAPSSPVRSREVEEQTSSIHVRVHQIPKDVDTTVPLANCSDRFHQSAVHIPVTWRPKQTNARKEKTASVGCNMVSTPWFLKRTVLETEMFSWFWNAHWTLESFTFSKLVRLMYLQCYLEIQPCRVCQSHVTPCVQFGFYCTHGVFVNLLFTVSWLIWIRQCHRNSEHLHCKQILFRQ